MLKLQGHTASPLTHMHGFTKGSNRCSFEALSLFSVEEQNLFPGAESLGVSSPHNVRVRLPLSLFDSQQASWPFPAN